MEIMMYQCQKIAAFSVGKLYTEYQDWLDRRNSKDMPKITIVSVNTLKTEFVWFLFITYYYN